MARMPDTTTQTSQPEGVVQLYNQDRNREETDKTFFICIFISGMLIKGGYRLGDAYVFPTSLQPRLDGSILPAFPKMPSM
jgi:hypothetical protein